MRLPISFTACLISAFVALTGTAGATPNGPGAVTANASAAKRPVSISDAKRVANTAISGQFKYEVASTPQPTADTPTDFGIGKATRINRFTVDVVVGEFYGYDARGELMCSWTTRVFRTSTGQLNWRYKKDTECSLTGEPAKPLPN